MSLADVVKWIPLLPREDLLTYVGKVIAFLATIWVTYTIVVAIVQLRRRGPVKRARGATLWIAPVRLVTIVGAQMLFLTWSTTAEAFCNEQSGSTCHEDITREAFNFLRPWPRGELVRHVRDPDDLSFIDDRSAYHFDDCNFDGGTAAINARYMGPSALFGVLSGLSPSRREVGIGGFDRVVDYPLISPAMQSWARALHAAQDFYSHSNWVEMGLTRSSADICRPSPGDMAQIVVELGRRQR